MSDKEEVALDEKINNTVITIGNYNFTPAKLMILATVVSSILGGLYASFEVYKDYMDMKKAIQEYVTPDFSAVNEKLSVLQKEMESTKSSVSEATSYTNEIKNDLKSDIRRLESVVENVERSAKQSQREVDQEIKSTRSEMTKLERQLDLELRKLNKEVDDKIKKALDNPLANR
jgi:septal ring factor EnvC (AmiA/AmiB activator)